MTYEQHNQSSELYLKLLLVLFSDAFRLYVSFIMQGLTKIEQSTAYPRLELVRIDFQANSTASKFTFKVCCEMRTSKHQLRYFKKNLN